MWNPLLYAWLNQQLRAAFLQLLGCEPLTTDHEANVAASRLSSVRSRKRSSETHLRDPATVVLLTNKQQEIVVPHGAKAPDQLTSATLVEQVDGQNLLDETLQPHSGDISL